MTTFVLQLIAVLCAAIGVALIVGGALVPRRHLSKVEADRRLWREVARVRELNEIERRSRYAAAGIGVGSTSCDDCHKPKPLISPSVPIPGWARAYVCTCGPRDAREAVRMYPLYRPGCAHPEAVPVESSVTGETLCYWCPDCETQLPTKGATDDTRR